MVGTLLPAALARCLGLPLRRAGLAVSGGRARTAPGAHLLR